jgi:hypothetical protein
MFPVPDQSWFLLPSFYSISAFPALDAQVPVVFWSSVSALVDSAPFSSGQNFALALLRQFLFFSILTSSQYLDCVWIVTERKLILS